MKNTFDKTKKPFIIALTHEKGGTGKSTIATHLSVGLMYSNPLFKVGLIDLDSRQLSSYNFFQNRKKYSDAVPMLFHCDKICGSIQDSRKQAYLEDLSNMEYMINYLGDCDFIIIDTSGSYSNFTKLAVFWADLVITPVMEGHFDLDAIVNLNKLDKNIFNGPFYEIIFEQRKNRIKFNRHSFEWVVVINRAATLQNENADACKNILENLRKNLDFALHYTIKDRIVYKELCSYGLTIFDLPSLLQDLSMTKIKAHAEMDQFVVSILEIYNSKTKKENESQGINKLYKNF